MSAAADDLQKLKRLALLKALREGHAAPRPAQQTVPRADRDAPLPLSWEQQRLWFIDQFDRDAGRAYHIPCALRLEGGLRIEALRAALDRIVARHEVLRTRFARRDGQAVQVVEAGYGFALEQRDLSALPPEQRQQAARELGAAELARRFDLENGPLVRGLLLRLGAEEHVLLLTQHHIVSDGWSVGVLLRELAALYQAFREGRPDPLPPLPLQYADYAAWQRAGQHGERIEADTQFWQAQLAGAPVLLELPTTHARPAQQDFAGASMALPVPPDLAASLRRLGQAHGCTLFMTMLAAWALLMSRLSGQDDVVIGSPVANRARPDFEPLVGFFVNTLALRVRVDDGATMAQLLAEVRATTLAAHAHQALPFEQVVEAVKPPRSMSHGPLFQVMLALNNTPGGTLELPDLRMSPQPLEHTTAQCDLMLSLSDDGRTLRATLEYATSLFDAAAVARLGAQFLTLLGAIADDARDGGACRLGRLPLLDGEQRSALLRMASGGASFGHRAHLHQLFERQAAQRPDAPAVVCGTASISYGELNLRSNRLAHSLIAQGVGPDQRVALCAERGIALLVGLIGILKAGAGYVPLDPAYPAERLAYMLSDSAPVALVCGPGVEDRIPACAAPRVLLDADGALPAPQPGHDPVLADLDAGHLAYVIYTSGSTGAPKGVMVEHGNLTRLFDATASWFGFGPDDVWTLFHSFAFDFSVWEIWGALAHGGKLVVAPTACTRSPQAFWDLLCEHGVTILNQTPSAFRQLAAAQPAHGDAHRLRRIIFGGEALELHTLAPWFARNDAGRTRLVNMYGITEITVHASYREIIPEDVASGLGSMIGTAIPDLQLHILDRHLEPAPFGAVGEIYVGGAGVARGYLNRPELSAERFLRNHLDGSAGGRLYKTGDLARRLPDGQIEYIGRNDAQVKIRGFRIELGEIEARLAACPGIAEAVVVAREDAPGQKRLVAYVVAQEGALPVAAALREALLLHLADYMVPSAFVTVERLPLTANGKLDTRALPAPGAEALASRTYAAPEGALEQAIAATWCELLGIDKVGRHDHFFELGGHSLMVVSLIEKLRRHGVQVEVKTVFAAPTPAALALAIGTAGAGAGPAVPPNGIPPACRAITPAMLPLVRLSQDDIDLLIAGVEGGAANVQDIYPLGPLQQGILFHHLAHPDSDAYLLRTVLSFDTRTRLDAFLDALQQVIARHDILRTAVRWHGLPLPVQVVLREARLPRHEMQTAPDSDALEQLLALTDPRRASLDLGQAPLLAAHFCADPASGRWHLALLDHHIVSDNTTLRLVLAEVQALLLAGAGAVAPPLPPVLPYRNFIAQTLAVTADQHEAWFRAQLGDVEEGTVPFGILAARENGACMREARAALAPQLAQQLRTAARQCGVPAAVLFHVAWALVVGSCSGRDDVVFGTVLSGRLQGTEGADQVLGMFINTLPLRVVLGRQSLGDVVAATHANLSGLLEHEQAPLALAQRCSRVPVPGPLFTALLNYRHGHAPADQAAELATRLAWQGIHVHSSEERTSYPLTLAVSDLGRGFSLTVQCDAVDPERVLGFVQQALARLAAALSVAPATPACAVDLLPADERRRLLAVFNDSARDYPGLPLVHQLFEGQAARMPDTNALACGAERMSYRELNDAANRVAADLLALGLRPDQRVALCVERSAAMVVGVLAVLKAGGAYVPLDPAYPAQRLAHMLEDSAPVALLTQERFRDALAAQLPAGLPLLALDGAAHAGAGPAPANPDPVALGLRADHLAYVIYTSGSTGRPKGVMVEHASLLNFLHAMSARPGIGAGDTLLAVTTLSFDIAGLELYLPLMHGARMVLTEPGAATDPERLCALVEAERVTLMQATPATWRMLLDAGWRGAPAMTALCGGEALPAELGQRLAGCVGALWNMYGPTETTIWSTCRQVHPGQAAAAIEPIGRPIANTTLYLLDRHMRLAPQGVPGELYIGGEGLARGYLNQPALTHERFVPDPFGTRPGARLYRTGDLARWREDGELEYLGRNDFQVKIRGFRIETGEIEAQLAACAGVRQAAVLARRDGHGGGAGAARLVAYVVPQPGAAPSVAGLRAELALALPDYMRPSAYVLLDAFTLTPNGKLDRLALPMPDAAATHAWVAPQGDIEEGLARVWCELLGATRVGRDDDFFELGGHSLMAIQLVVRMRAMFQVDVPVLTIFQAPTLAGLAQRIGMLEMASFDNGDIARVTAEMEQMSEEELMVWLEQQDALEANPA